jgi:hypothetical protein
LQVSLGFIKREETRKLGKLFQRTRKENTKKRRMKWMSSEIKQANLLGLSKKLL